MPDDFCVRFAHRFLLKLLETFFFFFKSVTTRVFPCVVYISLLLPFLSLPDLSFGSTHLFRDQIES